MRLDSRQLNNNFDVKPEDSNHEILSIKSTFCTRYTLLPPHTLLLPNFPPIYPTRQTTSPQDRPTPRPILQRAHGQRRKELHYIDEQDNQLQDCAPPFKVSTILTPTPNPKNKTTNHESLFSPYPALHRRREEVDAVKKTALRARVNDYTRRAEELKSLLYGDSVSKSKVGQSTVDKIGITNSYTELYNQSTSTPKLASGLEIGSVAEQYMAEGQYKAALEKFQGSLGVLVPLLASEPKGRRRDLLHQQIQLWLVQAENTKSLLSLTDMNGANIAEAKETSSMEG
uniref:MIT domain-containing protein n=1 Tax=Timema douglasi TaxID=61478 RepID=A0A7R8VCX8_TIMDO|nr:unnamed protein product [Timema douglasi]